jgi:ABC-type sulfate transport system permease subunit
MKHSISWRRQKRSRGAVFVETGLVLVVFMFMVMGAFDFAQFLFIHQALVDRGRSAARWGAVNDPTNTTAIQNMVLYNQTTVPVNGSGVFGVNSSMVSVSTQGSGTSDYRLIVSITNSPYTMISPIIGGTHMGANITITIPLGLIS